MYCKRQKQLTLLLGRSNCRSRKLVMSAIFLTLPLRSAKSPMCRSMKIIHPNCLDGLSAGFSSYAVQFALQNTGCTNSTNWLNFLVNWDWIIEVLLYETAKDLLGKQFRSTTRKHEFFTDTMWSSLVATSFLFWGLDDDRQGCNIGRCAIINIACLCIVF